MSGRLLSTIDQRTRLAGHNRLALLLFRLCGKQRFGVNVFKVQEVMKRPRIWPLPTRHPQVVGVADVRGRTLPVLDLGRDEATSGGQQGTGDDRPHRVEIGDEFEGFGANGHGAGFDSMVGLDTYLGVVLANAKPLKRCAPRVKKAPAIGGSSNGRTADSDSAYLGSNPSPPTSRNGPFFYL